MKKQDTKNDKSTDQETELNHQELNHHSSGDEVLALANYSETMVALYKKMRWIGSGEISVRTGQLADLTGMRLRIEPLKGVICCINDDGCWEEVKRDVEGTFVLTLSSAQRLAISGEPFMAHMVEVLLTEAEKGQHTQKSLDEAMALCEELIPNRLGWVDAHALYRFFKVEGSFSWWCKSIISCMTIDSTPGYRHSWLGDDLEGERFGDLDAQYPFRLNSRLAFRVALSVPTPRGSLLRSEFLCLSNTWRYRIDFDWEAVF